MRKHSAMSERLFKLSVVLNRLTNRNQRVNLLLIIGDDSSIESERRKIILVHA